MSGAPDYSAYYRTLDLDPGASPDEIDENWKLLVTAWHPDKFTPSLRDRATGRLQEINRARDELVRYWRKYGKAPPRRAGPAASQPPGASSAPPSRPPAAAARNPLPHLHRFVRLSKWLALAGVIWAFWQPLAWSSGATIVQMVFWLMLLAGSAQLFDAVAGACFGTTARPRRRRPWA